MSDDIDDYVAPKDMDCPGRITPTSMIGAKTDGRPCLFCDGPQVLEVFDGSKEGQGKWKEKDQGKEYSALRKSGTAGVEIFRKAVNKGGKKSVDGSGEKDIEKSVEEEMEEAKKRKKQKSGISFALLGEPRPLGP